MVFCGLSSLVATHFARARFTGSGGHLLEGGSGYHLLDDGSGGQLPENGSKGRLLEGGSEAPRLRTVPGATVFSVSEGNSRCADCICVEDRNPGGVRNYAFII